MEQNIMPTEPGTVQQTPVITITQSFPPTPPPLPPKKSNGLKIFFFSFIVLVVLASSVVVFLGMKDAEEVTSKALKSFATLKAYQVETVITDMPQSGSASSTINFSIKANLADPAMRLAHAVLRAEVFGFLIDGEFKVIGDSFYVKVNKAPFITAFLDQANVGNKWIYFNMKDATDSPIGPVLEKVKNTPYEEKTYELISKSVIRFTDKKFLFQDMAVVRESHFEIDKIALQKYLEELIDEDAKDLGQSDEEIRIGKESLASSLKEVTFGDSYITTNLITGSIVSSHLAVSVNFGMGGESKMMHDVIIISHFKELPETTEVNVPAETMNIDEILGGSLYGETNTSPAIGKIPYTDSSGLYTLSYPSTWTSQNLITPSDPRNYISQQLFMNITAIGPAESFSVGIFDITEMEGAKDLNGFVSENYETLKADKTISDFSAPLPITLSGFAAKRYTYTEARAKVTLRHESTMVLINGYAFNIDRAYDIKQRQSFSPVSDEILRSLKLNASSATNKYINAKSAVQAMSTEQVIVGGVSITPKIDTVLLDSKSLESIQTQIYSWKAIKTFEDCVNAFKMLLDGERAIDKQMGQAYVNACAYYLMQK